MRASSSVIFVVNISFKCGFPKVTEPVLSNTNACMLCRFSKAEGSLKITPADVAFAEPSIIAIGVASPSAHGHAMIKTETAVKIAFSKLPSLGNIVQAKPTIIAINIITGTNTKLDKKTTNIRHEIDQNHWNHRH